MVGRDHGGPDRGDVLVTGDEHPRAAVDTAVALFRAVGYGTEEGPWVHLGAGVHTGPAFVGYVSQGQSSEFTALGDTINVAAHLAARAGPGEILVTARIQQEAEEQMGFRFEEFRAPAQDGRGELIGYRLIGKPSAG